MQNKIFYSWQVDTPAKVNRNLIERALQLALNRIGRNTALESATRDLAIDRDTKGIPGSPPIVETIFRKIDAAAVFLPDLTFVGSRADGRPTPNPNVLIEYGWALKALSYRRLIPVMNTAFGEPTPENMPFDMRHLRNPIRFNCAADADDSKRREVQNALSKEIENAILHILKDSAEREQRLRRGLDTNFGVNGRLVFNLPRLDPLRVSYSRQFVSVVGKRDRNIVVFSQPIKGTSNQPRGDNGFIAYEIDEGFTARDAHFHDNQIVVSIIGSAPESKSTAVKIELGGANHSASWEISCDGVLVGSNSGNCAKTGGVISLLTLTSELTPNKNFSDSGLIQLQLPSDFPLSWMRAKAVGNCIFLFGVLLAPGEEGSFVYKFRANGHLDPTFGILGRVNLKSEIWLLALTDMECAPDGRLIFAGYGNEAVVICLRADGAIDKNFGQGGLLEFRADGRSTFQRLSFNNDKIILVGNASDGNSVNHVFVVRTSLDGEVDASFNERGFFQFSVSPADQVADICLSGENVLVLCKSDFNAPSHFKSGVASIYI